MSYSLKFSDNTKNDIVVPAMPPGINAVDTSLSLVGRGYPNYGEKIAENFLHLLENFANQISPENPIEGQLWYDTSNPDNKVLRVLDGTNWSSVSGIYQQITDPKLGSNQGLKNGDIWVDTNKSQLKIYSSGNWTTVGPSTSTDTGAIVATLPATDDGTYDVILNKVNGKVISIVADSAFTPNPLIGGFGSLTVGTNLAEGSIVNGTALAALNLITNNVTYPVSSFLRKDNEGGETITGAIRFVTPTNQIGAPGRDGVVIFKLGDLGTDYIQFYKSTNDAVIANNTPGGKLIFKTTGVTPGLTNSMYIEKSLVKINVATGAVSSTTGALVVAGGVGIGGNLYVGGTIFGKLRVGDVAGVTSTFGGIFTITNTTIATSTITGALTVAGGVGIGGNLYVGSTATSTSKNTGALRVAGGVGIGGNLNVGSTAVSTSTDTGALRVAGGVGIGGNLNVGSTSSVFGNLYIGENTSTTYIGGYDKWFVLDGIPKETTVGIAGIELRGGSFSGNGIQSQINFVARTTGGTDANSGRIELTNSANKTNTGIMKIYTAGFTSGLVEALRIDDSQIVSVRSNEISNSTTTGALVVAGGVGIGGSLYVGGLANITSSYVTYINTSTGELSYGFLPTFNTGTMVSSAVSAQISTTAAYDNSSISIATTEFVGKSVPKGVIWMWNSSAASIPLGFQLCDGTNGTPDLRDRFVVGAGNTYTVNSTGGSADAVVVSHSHSVTDPGHTHSTSVNPNFTAGGAEGGGRDSVGQTASVTGSAATGITVASTGVSGTNANLPPYYALCYIQKMF